jgi:hypothetical protein
LSPRRAGRTVPVVLAILAAALAVGAAAFSIPRLRASRRPSSGAAPAARRDELFRAFKPLADDLVEVLESRRTWRAGQATTLDFALTLDAKRPSFEKARNDIVELRLAHSSDRSLDLYVEAAQLYLEMVRTLRVAVADVAEPLRLELDRSADRIRTLADRIYDQAKSAGDPGRTPTTAAHEEYRLTTEVPDWVDEGLAAGPPLADPPAPAPETPAIRQAVRPQQPERTWLDAVRVSRIPDAGRLGAAIDAHDVAALRAVADDLATAVDRLRAVPDPARGGRARSAVLNLGLLVHEESARIGQGAGLIADPSVAGRLADVARRLALIGDDLWDGAFGPRTSGFDRALLRQRGP